MFFTYVLFSEQHNKIYIGQTQDIKQRLSAHNGLENKGWTASFPPWTLLYVEEFATRSQAMRREKEQKTARGRKFIWEMITPQK